ncbi:MAG: cobalamin biosynthesis protein CobD [Rhodospirillales bacterium]|nr:cobalamin biosynthesis protein CobD [Rhodospirillales bacterium]
MFSFSPAADAPLFDPLAVLLIALLIDSAVGEVRIVTRWLPHPVTIIGRLVAWCDAKLNRETRSEVDRLIRGALVVLFVCAVSIGVGWCVAWLARHHDFGWIPELILVTALLAQRSLYDHVRAVFRALKSVGLQGGRDAVAHIVGRDVRQLDEHGVARSAIESCAENFADAVVAPTFWYLLFGLPGMLAYKAVNTMDSMIGYKTPRYRSFGFTAARLDDVLNWVPARLSGLYLALAAAFIPTASPGKAFRTMVRDARKHRSPNAGWPEGAAAGALGLALAGPRRYAQEVVDDPWIGDGRARAHPRDIDRALVLYVAGCVINALVVMAFVAARLIFT